MLKAGRLRVSAGLAAVAGWFRKPELMVFLPAVTLASFWFGGESLLIMTALGMPMLFALAGAFRFPGPPAPQQGPALRPQLLAHLDAALVQAPERGLQTGCLAIAFDENDAMSERHGRAAQAEMLERAVERLAGVMRPGDIVARLEGGAFAVGLAPVRRLDLEVMVQLATRLQAALAPAFSIDAARVYVTASVGFCLAGRSPAAGGAALLDAARVAADEALRHGPGAIRAFAPEMARQRADKDARRDELEVALDSGEIIAHFQPQVSTDTGAVTGFEALARWQHPEHGLLPPASFLPDIEATGLAERLGEVMLQQALRAMAAWEKAGQRVPLVGVNFSAAELRNPRLAERLKWEIDRFDLSPDRLAVEVLETVVADADNDVLVSNMAALARMGCGIDLDDFGTGHASITNIRRFAVRRIKIDRSFVTRVDQDRDQQKVVSAVLSMAERLGIATLAEGVETAGEHAMLAQLGCGHVQGFAIGRPMPFEQTLAWLASHRSRTAATPRLTHRAR